MKLANGNGELVKPHKSLMIIWNDICAEQADAIVTLASPLPCVGPGMDASIHKAAGPSLLDERKKFGVMEPGMVRVSESYDLKRSTEAKWIIHTMGPMWGTEAGAAEELVLEACYLRVLFKAVELKCKVIAMPVFSSGKFGMPVERALSVAVRVITEFLKVCPSLKVKLVSINDIFRACARDLYSECFSERKGAKDAAKRIKRMSDSLAPEYDEIKKELADQSGKGSRRDSYFQQYKDATMAREAYGRPFHELFGIFTTRFFNQEKAAKTAAARHRRSAGRAYVTDVAQLAEVTGIHIRTIRKMKGQGAHTSRDKIFALAVAMRLTVAETKALLAVGEHQRIRQTDEVGKGRKSLYAGLSAAEKKKLVQKKRVEGRQTSKAVREKQAARDEVIFEFLKSDKCRYGTDVLNEVLVEKGMAPLELSSKRKGAGKRTPKGKNPKPALRSDG